MGRDTNVILKEGLFDQEVLVICVLAGWKVHLFPSGTSLRTLFASTFRTISRTLL
jgi:hypothetical protein